MEATEETAQRITDAVFAAADVIEGVRRGVRLIVFSVIGMAIGMLWFSFVATVALLTYKVK